MLQVLDVDLQNEIMEPIALINHYMNLSDEEIDRIHEEYYGDDDKLVMMIIGEINFPHPKATDKYRDKIFVEKVQRVEFAPKSKVHEIGEEYLADGYSAYLVPSMQKEEICSDSYWYMFDEWNNPVAIDNKMRVAVGFDSVEEMIKHYSKRDTMSIRRIDHCDKCTFWWESYNRSEDYYGRTEEEKALTNNPKKTEVNTNIQTVLDLAETIVEDNTLYQNLYRCNEAYPALLNDDQLWKDTMNEVIAIIQRQIPKSK
jgi:hypothetical protein